MSILTLFVVIPVIMLLGLWLSRNLAQIRGVMVVGATALLALSAWLTITFIQMRNAGNTDPMLFTYSVPWFKSLNIAYSVGVDGVSVVMILLSSIIVFTGTFASWQLKPLTKEYFLLVCSSIYRCLWILYLDRYVHNVHVLRGSAYPNVPSYWCMG